jgi:hypothetical protein
MKVSDQGIAGSQQQDEGPMMEYKGSMTCDVSYDINLHKMREGVQAG